MNTILRADSPRFQHDGRHVQQQFIKIAYIIRQKEKPWNILQINCLVASI